MSLPHLVRLAGLVSVVAAALIVVSKTVTFLSGGTGLVNGVMRVVASFCSYSIWSASTPASQKGGKSRAGGFLAMFLGTILVAAGLWFEAFAVPHLKAVAARLVKTTPTGVLIAGGAASFASFGAGWLLFGIASFEAQIFPRRAAVVLIVGALVGFPSPLSTEVGGAGPGRQLDRLLVVEVGP